ncbi:hypothetical protein BGW36DRAFT_299836 [Talaromyces proteolyticus]|uniref:Capsule polysaccharide biosynthesis protein n=1 Tax=Talaromyces proteolyticus TaxID=1131652 RepID=A0AAD4KPV0_9EURO|nr:uncharacterized protein BGW36DRAFT_299836 [Talaromyces proteolyticus]KAH8695528.1 hypothetical protein BGW36DRAFT_299836 [Talaromyces proteolyticus]
MALNSEPFHLVEFWIPFSWSLVWKVLVTIFLLSNFKSLPFAWHIRLLRGYRWLLRSNRPKDGPSPAKLFQPMILSSGNSLGELDYNLHKSNSTYFADLDIARAHLMCTLFSSGVDYARNARKRTGILGVSDDLIGLALGAVSCTFRKEVKPFQSYEIWTRVLSWDEKWMYTVTHFVRKDTHRPRSFTLLPPNYYSPRQGKLNDLARKEDAIFASALSKCVWKKGRRTVSPEIMLQVSGLLPPRPGQEDLVTSLRNEPLEKLTVSKKFEEYYDLPFKLVANIENTWDMLKDKFSLETTQNIEEEEGRIRNGKTQTQSQQDCQRARNSRGEEWTWERVEQERLRGMDIARSLAEMDRLHGEFTADTDALSLRQDLW